MRLLPLTLLTALAIGAGPALADITVGVTISATGPAASLGIPEKNTRKLISEHKVDVVVGSTITPNSLAMIDVVAESQTPMISLAASARIVSPMDAKRH